MKTLAKLILVFTIAFFVSCQKGTTDTPSVYFEKTADSIQNGGIKVIPITTSKGTFKVWTKRIGNNPKIKLLLLNG